MQHYLCLQDASIEIMGVGACRGTNLLPRHLALEDCRFVFEMKAKDTWTGTYDSKFVQLQFHGVLPDRKISGMLEIKNVDTKNKMDLSKIPHISKDDEFLLEGFLNCDIFHYIHGAGTKPEQITFLTRCLINLKA
jgi:hypothetical protein